MILRDQIGELECGLGDLFSYKGCQLEIVCPDKEASALFGKPVLCVRLHQGVLEHKGETFQITEGRNPPLFIFESDLVATCFRQQRKAETAREPIQHPPEFNAIESTPLDKPEKATSGKKSKVRNDQDQPTLW